MNILNLTQHNASIEQVKAGVYTPGPQTSAAIKSLLTFSELPSTDEIHERAEKLYAIVEAESPDAVMVGGAPYLLEVLVPMLRANGYTPLYAFSKRVVTESDGVKTSVFKHLGFVSV